MSKISLCMIVGNEQDYIQRCLMSFLRIADEVVLVRAIGNQTPDQTEQMARELCALHGKPLKFSEYNNNGIIRNLVIPARRHAADVELRTMNPDREVVE